MARYGDSDRYERGGGRSFRGERGMYGAPDDDFWRKDADDRRGSYEDQRAANFRDWDRGSDERYDEARGGGYRDRGEGRFGDEREQRAYGEPRGAWRHRGQGQRRQTRARSGLAVFDKTLQTTHIWLNEIMDELGPDKQHAWKVLSVVLHKLRDRLPVDVAAHLGAQLPLLIRGVYYDQFTPARQPTDCDREEFVAEVAEWLADTRPTDPRAAVIAVFQTLSRHLPVGEIENVQDALPRDLRNLWISVEESVVPPPGMRSAAGNLQRYM